MKFFLSVFLVMVFTVFGLPSQGLSAPITYTTDLNGASEAPPNASPATGFAKVIIDTDANTLAIDVSFSGLLALPTAAHIHGPTPNPGTGTAAVMTQTPTFEGFPTGASGTYSHLFDTSLASTWRAAFINDNGGTPEGAEAAFAAALADGKAYFNIHTSLYPAGEIRGFLAPTPVPATVLLFGAGLAGLAGTRGRRKKQ